MCIILLLNCIKHDIFQQRMRFFAKKICALKYFSLISSDFYVWIVRFLR